MPGGRPRDDYRYVLAQDCGIPYEKARKLRVCDLERLVEIDEEARRILSPKPRKHGISPRYTTPQSLKRARDKNGFESRKMAESVAIILERITGEDCTIGTSFGQFTVIRHCAGGKMEEV